MVVSDYFKPIDAIVIEEKPTSELPTPEDLRARMSSPKCLTFTEDAASLRTHFRDYVLQTVFELAREELGNSIKSAVVETWHSYDEPVPPILLFTIIADMDKEKLEQANLVIIDAVLEEAKLWSDEQKEDYGKIIYFGLEPIDV